MKQPSSTFMFMVIKCINTVGMAHIKYV